MGDSHVVEESVMYRTVILHIPHHVLERARGILSLADTAEFPFTELKNRLVEFLTPSILDRCNGILRGAELGGRRPTELLEVPCRRTSQRATCSRRASCTSSPRISRTWWQSSSTS